MPAPIQGRGEFPQVPGKSPKDLLPTQDNYTLPTTPQSQPGAQVANSVLELQKSAADPRSIFALVDRNPFLEMSVSLHGDLSATTQVCNGLSAACSTKITPTSKQHQLALEHVRELLRGHE